MENQKNNNQEQNKNIEFIKYFFIYGFVFSGAMSLVRTITGREFDLYYYCFIFVLFGAGASWYFVSARN
ncbi:hypothetical protein N9L20_07465 [Flavobacteriaceae bacterium]|nr:hypothetical protein [Flavobacteriaceae bacterium]